MVAQVVKYVYVEVRAGALEFFGDTGVTEADTVTSVASVSALEGIVNDRAIDFRLRETLSPDPRLDCVGLVLLLRRLRTRSRLAFVFSINCGVSNPKAM
jgi:hypothetical protein